jgi:hypothetical protein
MRIPLGASVLALASSLPTAAQDARVVSCNSANGQILEIDFATGTSTLIILDGARVNLQSCVFRSDGAAGLHLIVADRNGEVVFYENATGGGEIVLGKSPANPANPNGLSLDPAQNLYGVTSAPGASTASEAKVWMLRRDDGGSLAGGYAGPVAYIDATIPGIEELGETILVTSNVGALSDGDLLVLSSKPATVLRYRAADLAAFRSQLAAGTTPAELTPDVFIHPPTAAVPAAQRFPSGATPNGMDLTQDGSLLISAGEGLVLHYLADGTRLTNGTGGFVDFATGLGNGQFKIATGQQDGALRAFVTDRNKGEVHRFGFAANGTGILEATVADPESPDGIATTTAAVQPTPAGIGVVVTSSSLIVSTIETVPTAGVTAIQEFVFTDPRESEPGAPLDPLAPLHRSLDLDAEISSLLPAGVEIPAHVRAFRKLDPMSGLPTGDPTFILLVADSSAAVLGTIQHIADESLVLGYEPDCDDPSYGLRPQLFWRDNPATNEPPIPEGAFINVTNDCGTSRGITKSYSLFLPARDTRAPTAIFDEQFAGLGTALSGATCIKARTRKALTRQYNKVYNEYYIRGRPKIALAALNTFLDIVEANAADFASCTANQGGDLRARATASIFTLSGL